MSVDLQDVARRLIEARRSIGHYFDADLFADPARDILLALFAAGDDGRPSGLGGYAAVAQVPETTARRWIAALEKKGFVVAGDMLRLTERGRTAMAGYLTSDRMVSSAIGLQSQHVEPEIYVRGCGQTETAPIDQCQRALQQPDRFRPIRHNILRRHSLAR